MADLENLPDIIKRFEKLERISRDFLSGYQLSEQSQGDLEVVYMVLKRVEIELKEVVARTFFQEG